MDVVPAVPVLSNEHLKSAKILASRNDLLQFLPKDAVFCEVGVAYGDFSALVLQVCRPRKFIAIDCFDLEQYPTMWGFSRLAGGPHEEFYRKRFESELASGRLELMRGYSNEVLPLLPDSSVDIFYIDAWHTYESVSEELNIIKTKIKPTGWILLNDYTLYDVVWEMPYGVIQAAHEFMLAEGWEMKFLALHPLMFCDIAIRKIGLDEVAAVASPAHRRRAPRTVSTSRRRAVSADASRTPVHLLIWGLDDIRGRSHIVAALAKRGIVSSICAQTDDVAAADKALKDMQLRDLVIFPSIDSSAKPPRIAAIIEAAECAASNTVLIEDNLAVRADVAALLPGIRIADTSLAPRILADPRFKGESDPHVARLAEYKLLERRDAAGRATASDAGEPFLGPPVRILIEGDVAAHLDRAIELIGGTRQLNFTKRRLPQDLEQARQQLLGEISPFYVCAGLVRLLDDEDDWGYCGFYRTVGSELLDFCFSRRVLGTGVESWLYRRLGQPTIITTDDVASSLPPPQGADRLMPVVGDERGRIRPIPFLPEVRVRGGDDAIALAHYFRLSAVAVRAYTNEYRGRFYRQMDSSTLLLPELGAAPPGFYAASGRLGYSREDFSGDFLSPAPSGSILVYSGLADLYLPLYRHKERGFAVPVTLDISEDLTAITDDALEKVVAESATDTTQRKKIREIVGSLRAEYVWQPRLSLEDAIEIMRMMFERIPTGARLFVILPYEWMRWGNALAPRNDTTEYNAAMRDLARGYPSVVLLPMSEVVAGADEVQQEFDHFDRVVYFRLFRRIVDEIEATSRSSSAGILPTRPDAATRRAHGREHRAARGRGSKGSLFTDSRSDLQSS